MNNNNHNNHNTHNTHNTFKLRLSKLLHSSFNSCRTKPTSDVSNQPFFFPPNHHHHRQLIDLFSPKPQPFSSLLSSKPKPKQKQKKPKKNKTHHRKQTKTQDFISVTDNYYYDCCSSDEDEQTDDEATLFSSRSFSSDTTLSFRKNVKTRRKKKKKKGVRKVVRDSVAVVKKSSDPREDFRVSMLEMIVERQLLGVKDLEDLLECFLTLNCEQHHEVICEVFMEIWETLFADWF